MAKIVAIDPDARVRKQYESSLTVDGHEVWSLSTAVGGLRALSAYGPELVLMDLVQTDLDGNELLRSIRRSNDPRALPVVVVTSRNDEVDRIVAFELGADDYVLKPFSSRELALRIRALLRQRATAAHSEASLGHGRIRIDPMAHRVWVDERQVTLTALEFRLLNALIERRSSVQFREDLLHRVWGNDSGVSVRIVDAYIKRLRRKLGAARHSIETVRGVGYRMDARAVR